MCYNLELIIINSRSSSWMWLFLIGQIVMCISVSIPIVLCTHTFANQVAAAVYNEANLGCIINSWRLSNKYVALYKVRLFGSCHLSSGWASRSELHDMSCDLSSGWTSRSELHEMSWHSLVIGSTRVNSGASRSEVDDIRLSSSIIFADLSET